MIESLNEIQDLLRHRDFRSGIAPQIARVKKDIEEGADESANVDEQTAEDMVQNSTTWSHLLFQELEREQRIPAADTGLLDVERLLHSPEDLFVPQIWNWLDRRPKDDIREACKTILTECPTASVMLSLRAVEHCLRKRYEEEENERLEAAWGQVLDQLMEKYTENDKRNDTVLTQLSDLPPVLSSLYYLKEKRNEVSHPDGSPNPEEVRRTLMIVASTITDIYIELQEIAKEQINLRDLSTGYSISGTNTQDSMEDKFYQTIMDVCERNDNNAIKREVLYEMGEESNLSREEMEEIISNLLMNERIYEISENRLRPI